MSTASPARSPLLQDELLASERLLWTSTPRPSRLAQKKLPVFFMGFIWIALALFWLTRWRDQAALAFDQGVVLFQLVTAFNLLVAFLLLSTPFWAALRASATVYAVTTDRALIVERGLFGRVTVHSFYPRQIGEVRRVQRADGSGDLILARTSSVDAEGHRLIAELGFFGIPNPREVETLVRTLVGAPSA